MVIKHNYKVCIIDTHIIVSNRFKYFKWILQALLTPPFYTACVLLPKSDLPTPEIQESSRFYPFFESALGAIDGTHIRCTLSAADRDASRNCKGILTQNCLAACSFNLHFLYFYPVGRGLHMTPPFFMTPNELIFTSQLEGITLQMLDLPRQMHCLSLIEACGTICLNGIVPRKCEPFVSSEFFSLMFF